MDGDPAHFEIELTPSSERPRATPPETTSGTGDEVPVGDRAVASSGDTSSGDTGSPERTRLVVVGLAAGVVALALGFILGRAGGDDETIAGDPAPSTDLVTESTTPPTGETLPGVVVPATESTETTTTLPAPATVRVELEPAVRGMPIEIVGISNGGDLVELDLSNAERTERDIGVNASSGPSQLIIGSDWLVVPNWDTGRTFVIEGDGEPRPVDLGPAWQIFPSADGETFWRLDDGLMMGVEGAAIEVTVDGEPTGNEVTLPRQPSLADPGGGFIVQEAGGTYRIDGDEITRISTGEIIALDAAVALVYECDEGLACSYVVIDRSDGTRKTLALDDAGTSRLRPPWWYANQRSSISPDHTVAVVMRTLPTLGQETFGVVDLASGEFVELMTNPNNPGGAWTPEGRYLFYLDGFKLMMFDRTTGESGSVTDDIDMPLLSAFAIRELPDDEAFGRSG